MQGLNRGVAENDAHGLAMWVMAASTINEEVYWDGSMRMGGKFVIASLRGLRSIRYRNI